MKMFAVKDMKAQTYLQPHFQKSVADELRSWEIAANEGDSMISRFPDDFRLYHLADFDYETGQLRVFEHPSDLGSAADFKRKPKEQMELLKA